MNDVFLIDVMYAAVAQREGLSTAVAHATEQTREEFVHYFDKHYQVFAQDTPLILNGTPYRITMMFGKPRFPLENNMLVGLYDATVQRSVSDMHYYEEVR